MYISDQDLRDIEFFLSKFNIDVNDICLVGSISLACIGIRKNNDIDIIIKSSIRDLIFKSNNTISVSQKIDIVKSPWSSICSDDDIIFNSNFHRIIKNKYKVVIPEFLYHKKLWLNRRKDKNDLQDLLEYSQMSKDWNQSLIRDHLPKQNFLNSFFKRSIRFSISYYKLLYQYFFYSNLKIIPPNILFSLQYKNDVFNRFDVVVRYMAIESFVNGDNKSYFLYNKMQEKRGNSIYEDPLIEFKKLIEEIKTSCIKKPIIVNQNMQLLDGAHRLACALFFNHNSIPIKIVRSNENVFYSEKWFESNLFSNESINLIKKEKNNIFLKNHMYFEILLWPPAQHFFDEIEHDIKKKYNILTSKTYNNYNDFVKYVKEIYKIDDIKYWKVKMKLDNMNQYTPTFRRLIIDVQNPIFKKKQISNNFISKKIEELKTNIRTKYSKKINNYFHDIIIHAGDNYHHSKCSEIVAKKFGLI